LYNAYASLQLFARSEIVGYVPDENIGENLEELCIRHSILKDLDDKVADTYLKKISYPHMLAETLKTAILHVALYNRKPMDNCDAFSTSPDHVL